MTVISRQNIHDHTAYIIWSIEMACSNNLKCSMVPQRIVLSVMGFIGLAVSFAIRTCLSVAITEMIVPKNNTNKVNDSSVCPADVPRIDFGITDTYSVYEKLERYNWTEKQQGWILSSFYVGYLIAHIPGGLLAEKFGGKWVLSMSVLLTSISNATIPQALPYGGIGALILIRTLMGLFGGVIFPAVNTLLSAWIPEKERGKLGSLALSGPLVGQLLSFYISGQILSNQPWPIVFYFWSFISIIWFIIFMLFCSKDPASNQFITEKELNYFKVEMGQLKRHNDLPATPLRSILTSSPMIALIISQMGHDCLSVTLAVGLSKYMKQVLGYSIDQVGLYLALSYLFMWIISILSGFICDYLIDRDHLTIVQARKLFTALARIIPAILLVAASYTACDRLPFVILLVVGMGFVGCYHPGMRINALDLSPNYAGSVISVTNGCGALSSWIFPNFIGMMIPDSTIEQWRIVFWTILCISIVRVAVYSNWASGDVQPWNNSNESKSPECDKLTNGTKHSNVTEITELNDQIH